MERGFLEKCRLIPGVVLGLVVMSAIFLSQQMSTLEYEQASVVVLGNGVTEYLQDEVMVFVDSREGGSFRSVNGTWSEGALAPSDEGQGLTFPGERCSPKKVSIINVRQNPMSSGGTDLVADIRVNNTLCSEALAYMGLLKNAWRDAVRNINRLAETDVNLGR